MTYSTVLITHVVNDAVIEGFILALLKSRHVPDSQLIIITDDKDAHMDALIATPCLGLATKGKLMLRFSRCKSLAVSS